MEQLQFTAVHEDGQHLVLSSPDGTELLLPIDERLRSALRSRGPAADVPAAQLSPRDVQAMIRAGQTAAEVAEMTGWPVDRVARFEGPITAEREHVAGLARAAHVRGRAAEGVVPTLEARVLERLEARGVDPENTSWDATRPAGGSWTVVVNFVAGQRQRGAAWRFEPADRTVEALDDEARWLSEDEQSLPGSAAGKQLLGTHGASEEVDLVTSMRERSRTRSRRKKLATRPDPVAPEADGSADDELPLEHVAAPAHAAQVDSPSEASQVDSPSGGPGDAPEGSGEGAPTDDGSATSPEPPSGAAAPRGPAPARSTSRRSRVGRRASRPQSAAPTPAAEPTSAPDPAAPAGEAAAVDGTTSFDVELDFDDNYEVDPTPQEATLADLFGPGETSVDDDPALDFLDEGENDTDEGPVDTEGDDEQGDIEAKGDDEQGDIEAKGDDEQGDIGAAAGTNDPAATDGGDDDEDDDDEDEHVSDADITDLTFDNDDPMEAADGTPDGGSADSAGSGDADSAGSGSADADPPADTPKPGARKRKDGRPGVPSWDDIMFGAKER